MKLTLMKTEEPKKVKGVYEGNKFIELWQNKDANFFWLKYNDPDGSEWVTFGWSHYDLANQSYERNKINLTLGEKQ